MNNQTSPTESNVKRPALSAGKAVLIGHLIVTVPAAIIMLGSFVVGVVFALQYRFLFLLVGFVLGWLWWSFVIPRWRRWAIRRGVDRQRLQKLAVRAMLTWPKGSIVERTEFKVKDD